MSFVTPGPHTSACSNVGWQGMPGCCSRIKEEYRATDQGGGNCSVLIKPSEEAKTHTERD